MQCYNTRFVLTLTDKMLCLLAFKQKKTHNPKSSMYEPDVTAIPCYTSKELFLF